MMSLSLAAMSTSTSATAGGGAGDTVVVMGDMGTIPTVASAVSSDPMVDATALSTGVSKFITAGVGGDTWKIPKVAYAVDDDTVAIPVEGGGDVHDNACSTDSFSGFSDPGGRFAITNESVHYHHRSGSHLLSDGYSCHGRVEQVNSLTAIDAHERQLFDKLLW